MVFRPIGVVLVCIACVLPVVAVAVIRRQSAAVSNPASEAYPQPKGDGLQLLYASIDLKPQILADRFLCRFPIGNGTAKPITIVRSTTSCGCAALRFQPAEVPPDGWGEAVVSVAARGRFGIVEAAVEAFTDDGLPPLRFTARLVLPPQPRLPGDEIRIPTGSQEIDVPILGGDARFRLVCLRQPQCSSAAFEVDYKPSADGGVLHCQLLRERPAAGRIRLRLGYEEPYAVDLSIRLIAE